jgi:hypothetical protein
MMRSSPPALLAARKPPAEPNYDHPLLTPLAHAQDAIARLEAKVEAASEAVAEGVRARMSYLEAAGWLRHVHVWIHPQDLALRDNALTGSYAAAAMGDRLSLELPSTAVQETELAVPPSDIVVNQALRLARLWRRLAELRTWRPLGDIGALCETLQSLGCGLPEDDEIADWLASIDMLERGPLLIRAGAPRPISLPFWSAPETHHYRLELHFGVQWMTDFLECVAAAALVGLREIRRLHQAEQKGRSLAPTARSRLPDALNAVIRTPIVTTGSLAAALKITPQAALGLLRQLRAAGIVREATGRASWRAFALI